MHETEPTPAIAISTRLGLEDYRALPDDRTRYELVDGALHMSPAPRPQHQRVSRRLLFALMEQLEHRGRGEVFDAPIDVVLSPHDVVQPDLAFVAAAHADRVREDAIHGPPDLVVEVLSPGTRRLDVKVKAPLYARAGVPHLWLVDPEIDRLEAFTLGPGGYGPPVVVDAPARFEPAAFPGLALDLAAVFARPAR